MLGDSDKIDGLEIVLGKCKCARHRMAVWNTVLGCLGCSVAHLVFLNSIFICIMFLQMFLHYHSKEAH